MNEPTPIDDQRAMSIIGCYSQKRLTRDKSGYGRYLLREPRGTIAAIGNSKGHCWVEEFQDESAALNRLLG